LLGVCTQVFRSSEQVSVVHAMVSAQSGGDPGWQPSVGLQTSLPSQNRPLLHGTSFGECEQVSVSSTHASTVHGMLSAQFGATPWWQPTRMSQISGPSQNRPLLQAVSFGMWLHPCVASMHWSVVHGTLSLQLGGVPGWQPSVGLQTSTPSQKTLLLQLVLRGVCSHESVFSTHWSRVQVMSSLQFGGVPGRQPCVGLQISTPSQKSPSLHEALFGECEQTSLVSSQASTVHGTVSAQFGGVPGRQP